MIILIADNPNDDIYFIGQRRNSAYRDSADFVATNLSNSLYIITSPSEDDQALSVVGTIAVDHDNNVATDVLAITSGGVDALNRLNSDDADFLAAHGLDATNDNWWVYTGSYGTLVIKDDGSFSYVLNPENATLSQRVDDVFTLQVTDANGNQHSYVLTVPVNPAGLGDPETVSIAGNADQSEEITPLTTTQGVSLSEEFVEVHGIRFHPAESRRPTI